MKDTTYLDIVDEIKDMYFWAAKGDLIYEFPEATEDFIVKFNYLVDKLYHRGMTKLKVDIPARHSDYVMRKGDWIWVEQDEGGVWFWDETKEHCIELDYENALPPREMFEYE